MDMIVSDDVVTRVESDTGTGMVRIRTRSPTILYSESLNRAAFFIDCDLICTRCIIPYHNIPFCNEPDTITGDVDMLIIDVVRIALRGYDDRGSC